MSIFYFINLYILSKINYILYIEGMGIQSTFKILGQCLLVIIVLCSFLLEKALQVQILEITQIKIIRK